MGTAEPHVEAFVDVLLNPAAELDCYERQRIPDKIVARTNPGNDIGRGTLLSHKLWAHFESEPVF